MEWCDIPFSTQPALISGGLYAIVISADEYDWNWQRHSMGSYPGGQAWTSEDSGATWAPSSAMDFVFETYMLLNSNPIANSDNYTTPEGTALIESAPGVLGNDTDQDVLDTLSVVAVNGAPATIDANITLTSGAILNQSDDGSFVYDPNGAFEYLGAGAWQVDSYVYTIYDNNGSFDNATVFVNVTGVNDAPVLGAIGNKSVNEGVLLSFTAAVSDEDAGDTLTFSLDAGFPVGAAITTGGDFTWTPMEAQGPAFYNITVRVSDGSLEDSETIMVTVGEANQAPVLVAIGNKAVDEGDLLSFIATATDGDMPANTLTYSLDAGYPTGAGITAGGDFTWTPIEAQGPAFYNITVRVSDGTADDSETIMITVGEVNQAPVLGAIGNRVVNELTLLTFTATATDADLPANTLTYTLDAGAPTGATITTGGDFTWTPTEAQGPAFYNITVRVSDGALDDSETIMIRVDEVNVAPVLGAIGNRVVDEQAMLTFTATATDADLPANALTYTLDAGAPAGASITAGGVFTWTPTEAHGPGNYTITVRVSDGAMTDTETINVEVVDVNMAPVAADDAISIDEDSAATAIIVLANDADADGDNIAMSSVTQGTHGTVVLAANGTWLTYQPEADYFGQDTFTYTISDGVLTDTATVAVTVGNVNDLPSITTADVATAAEDSLYSVDYEASDADAADTLVWAMATNAPFLAINAGTGFVSGTPGNSQEGSYWVNVSVSDGHGGLDWSYFTLTVTNTNDLPTITTAAVLDAIEGVAYSVDYAAADIDAVDVMTWSLTTDAAWLDIDPVTGVLSGTPNGTDVGSHLVKVSVSDGHGGADWSNFTLLVKLDTDGDTVPDETDADDDGDLVPDNQDGYPLDPAESRDTDGDGTGNNADTDDDDDGYPDAWEIALGTNQYDEDSTPTDSDNDGKPDGDADNSLPWMDSDDDDDGVLDADEEAPSDDDGADDGTGSDAWVMPLWAVLVLLCAAALAWGLLWKPKEKP